jgi:hypothetical protein
MLEPKMVCLLALAGLLLAAFLSREPHGHSQNGATSEAASEWAAGNFTAALNYLLPTDLPDSNYPDQDYISYRFTNSIIPAAREYSLSLMRRSDETPGPLHYYWIARVRMAEGTSILEQLSRLHALRATETLAEIEQQIKIRTWTFEEKTCPAIRTQAAKFQSIPLNFRVSSEIVLDAPSFDFEANTLGHHLKVSFYDDGSQTLASWARETRLALTRCGAPELAPARGEE